MATLTLVATLIANPYPIRGNSSVGLIVSVTDTHGQPVLGLSEAEFRTAYGFQTSPQSYEALPAPIMYSARVPALNADGSQIMEQGFGTGAGQFTEAADTPKFISVPGPAPQFGLPGNYLLTLARPTTPHGSDWIGGRAVIEVAVHHSKDHGQTNHTFDVAY
jgi:hypothetical protein